MCALVVPVPPQELQAAAGNRLYLDYVAGRDPALGFFSHGPLDFAAALDARQGYAYPRREVAGLLAQHNRRLGASARTMANISALGEEDAFCVITGQQAGLMGGPAYTAYKIATTIRLAAHLEAQSGRRVVPVFWLATEDHDLDEINHTFLIQRDGEVGRVSFSWAGKGRPVADLPLTGQVRRAFDMYWSKIVPGPYCDQAYDLFRFRPDEDYATWNARLWSTLFDGLVIVEPRTVRPIAGPFFDWALRSSAEIENRLKDVAERLRKVGYEPQLTSEFAGRLYTFDERGHRVRVEDELKHATQVRVHPELYSADAALRPLCADALLPVLASVLGPGEIAYQGMLRPLYALLGLPQPLLFPRKSYTVVLGAEAARLEAYGIDARDVLSGDLDAGAVLRRLVPQPEREMFAAAEEEVEAALLPLRAAVEEIDPSLGKTWSQTVFLAHRYLGRLRERAFRARASQWDYSRGELRRLQNALLPRGRLQERVLPLAHFVNQMGLAFVAQLGRAGALTDLCHQILILEDTDG